MSKYREEFQLHTPLEDGMIVCREAVAGLGWRVLEQSEMRLVCKEVTPQGTSFTWAAQVEILLAGESADTTKVTLNGSIFGLGPIQSGHLKGQVGSLRNRIELGAAKSYRLARSQTSTTLASELEKLAELHTRGILSDEEYHKAKARLLSKQTESA
jgi:hypothetical protein